MDTEGVSEHVEPLPLGGTAGRRPVRAAEMHGTEQGPAGGS